MSAITTCEFCDLDQGTFWVVCYTGPTLWETGRFNHRSVASLFLLGAVNVWFTHVFFFFFSLDCETVLQVEARLLLHRFGTTIFLVHNSNTLASKANSSSLASFLLVKALFGNDCSAGWKGSTTSCCSNYLVFPCHQQSAYFLKLGGRANSWQAECLLWCEP